MSKPPNPDQKAHRPQVARIDGAHPLPGGTAPAAVDQKVLQAAAAMDEAANRTQFQAQASQLADALKSRRHDIDQREAQLNSRVAKLENELRSARLWMSESAHAYREKEEELQSTVADLEARLKACAASEVSADEAAVRAEKDWQLRHESLAKREQRIASAESAMQEETESLRREREEWSRFRQEQEAGLRDVAGHNGPRSGTTVQAVSSGETPSDLALQMTQRQNHLLEGEQLLQQQMRELSTESDRLAELREATAAEAVREQQHLDEQQRQLDREFAEAQNQLEGRHVQLVHREEALRLLREETSWIHHETLEIRMVVEQTWAELVEVCSPAKITQQLARSRQQLADVFLLQKQELQECRDALDELIARLDDRADQLRKQRGEFESWAARRQEEIETQAARLVARETELEREEKRLAKARNDWSSERLHLQNRLRKLLLKKT
jgi:hypothetical protein